MDSLKGTFRSQFDLTGKTAVVTGAAGILGEVFCAALADHGANIVAVDIDGAGADRLADEIGGTFGVEAIGIGCDVSSESSVRGMIAEVGSRLGDIHILHNNAATKTSDLEAFFASVEDAPLATWREVMSVNLDGMFIVAREIGSLMARGRGGSIIQTASVYGVTAPDQRIYEGSNYLGQRISTPAAYSSSKAGVVGLTRHLAAYWGDAGVRVNALAPGGVRSGQNDEFVRRYSERVPLRRMARAEEMAGPLVYLASEASSYVTGQVLVADGGLTAW